MTKQELSEALAHPNVKAFLKMLRHGEGTSGEDGYRTRFGGELFDNNFVNHPKGVVTRKLGGNPITSSAAGAYQFLTRTWEGLVRQYGFSDFSPASQDRGAVALIAGRDALQDVIAGRFHTAVTKCNREWASLPGSPYGQPTVGFKTIFEIYRKAGGGAVEAPPIKPQPPVAPPAPIPAPPPAPLPAKPKSERSFMPPFLLATLPYLLDAVPKLFKLFGSGSDSQQRNTEAVQMAVDIAKTATGALNEQELIGKLQTDPEAVALVRAAVEENWFALSEVGGGVETARKADAAVVASGEPVWRSPSFLMAVAMLPLIYMILGAVIGLWGAPFSDDVRSAIANGVIGLVLGGLVGYYFGQVTSRNRQTSVTASS